MNAGPNFSDLTFDRMWSSTAERDKNTSMHIGVYRGNASIAIFSGTGGPPQTRVPLAKYFNVFFREAFKVVTKMGPDNKLTVPMTQWNRDAKKMEHVGAITFGIDASRIPYLGLVTPTMPAAKFPIRFDMKMDVSAIPELNVNHLALESFLAAMDNTANAINLTNFKRDPSARAGGGNRPGYGGGSNSRPAAVDVSDDIPY